MARAEVVCNHADMVFDFLQRSEVTVRKVNNVNVVAYARAVRRVVVVAEHVNILALADRNL